MFLPRINPKALQFKSDTDKTVTEEELLEIDEEQNLMSLMFASIDDEGSLSPKKSTSKEADITILKTDTSDEYFKLVLCYDKKSGQYQLWKKYRPKFVKFAQYEKQTIEQAMAYKSFNQFQWVHKNQSEISKEYLDEEMNQMFASQINITLVDPPIANRIPNPQLVVYAGGLFNLKEFSSVRLTRRRDPFLLQEINYIFWFLIYAIFQLQKASVYIHYIHPQNITIINQELRLINILIRQPGNKLIEESIIETFETIFYLYGFKEGMINKPLTMLEQQVDLFPSLVEVKPFLLSIVSKQENFTNLLHRSYPRKFLICKKQLVDNDEVLKEIELNIWTKYFRERGMTRYDPQILQDLGLLDFQRKVKQHLFEKKSSTHEKRCQEILAIELDNLILPYTREYMMKTLQLLKDSQKDKNFAGVVESYAQQSKIYQQMGETKQALIIIEKAEKLLGNVSGEIYYQRCLDVYQRQAGLLLLTGQLDKALEKQKLSMQLIAKLRAAHNQYLKNQMSNQNQQVVLLWCEILDQKGLTDQAIQELYNIIFKLEQKDESKGGESKKRKLQLAIYYDCLSQMYWRKHMYKLCLSYQEKSLEVKALYLHSVHPDVAYSQAFISRLNLKMRKESDDSQHTESVKHIRQYFVNAVAQNPNDPIFKKVCHFQCYTLTKKICGQNSTECQEECLRMAQVCYEMGQLDETKEYLNILQEALEETIPCEQLKPIYYEQCQILYEMRDFQRALKDREVEKLIKLFKRPNSLDYAAALSLKAAICSQLDKYDEAIKIKEESIRIKSAVLGNGHVEVVTARKALQTLKIAPLNKSFQS